MAEVSITIPNNRIPALKRAIEFAYVNGVIAEVDGVTIRRTPEGDIDPNGALSNQDLIRVFQVQTYRFWRKAVGQYQGLKAELEAERETVFDESELP